MGKINNDIYGNVIQNAKDIKELQCQMNYQNVINDMDSKNIINLDRRAKLHNLAGRLTCISMMLLAGITWALSKTVDKITDRVEKLEEKNVIDIEE